MKPWAYLWGEGGERAPWWALACWHPSRQIEALGGSRQVILRIEVGWLRQLLEDVPNASLAEARARGCDRIVPAIHGSGMSSGMSSDRQRSIVGKPRQSAYTSEKEKAGSVGDPFHKPRAIAKVVTSGAIMHVDASSQGRKAEMRAWFALAVK